MSKFNEISSIEFKFDKINNFYKYFKRLKYVKSKYEEINQTEIIVLKAASLFCDELVDIRFLKVRMKTGGKNMIIKI